MPVLVTSIFGELERFAAELYPYRVPITLGVALTAAALATVAVRRGWHVALGGVVRRHMVASTLVAAIAVAVLAPTGWYLFSPLWTRTTLDEASPLDVAAASSAATADGSAERATGPQPSTSPEAPTGASSTASPTATVAGTVVVARGEFEGADEFHFGRGDALLVRTASGEHILRFEDFSVRNGPDLFVYLSPSPAGYAEGALNLGRLKATDGNINYEVPAGTDVSPYRSAVIWCRQFGVLFATAALEAMP